MCFAKFKENVWWKHKLCFVCEKRIDNLKRDNVTVVKLKYIQQVNFFKNNSLKKNSLKTWEKHEFGWVLIKKT